MRISRYAMLVLATLVVAGCGTVHQTASSSVSRSGAGSRTVSSQSDTSLSASASASVVSAPSTTASSSSASHPTVPMWIDMITTSGGWGVRSSGALLRTTDGGATWKNVSPSGNVSPGNARNGAFLNASDAWVAEVSETLPNNAHPVPITIEHTDNGGQSWTSAKFYAYTLGAVDLSFANSEDGWAWVGNGVATAQESSTLFATTDGGTSWTQVAAAFTPGVTGKGYPGGCCKEGFSFINASTGWISGNNFGFAPTMPFVKTTDGGKTWSTQPLPLAPSVSAQANDGQGNMTVTAPVFHGTDGAICVQVGMGYQSYIVEFFTSTDAGNRWTGTTPLNDPLGCANWGFPSPGHLWVTDEHGIAVSHNEGSSWQAITPTGLTLQSTTYLDFLTPADGWAVGNGAVLKTTDGGTTWTKVSW